MGANFEIETVSRQFIPVEVAQSLFQNLSFSFLPKSITCIDDWDWRNEKILPIEADITGLVTEGRIIFLYGDIEGSHAGLCFFMEGTNFHTEVWFEAFLKPELEDGTISEKENFYSLIEQHLKPFALYEPICTAMGVEMAFYYHATEAETLAHSMISRLVWYPDPHEE